MSVSYVKNIYTEPWDDYQMSFFIPGVGGSKPFFDFMKTYDLHNDTIKDKYSSKPAQYYAVQLRCKAEGKPFNEAPPNKNWKETRDTSEKFKQAGHEIKEGVNKGAKKVEKFWDDNKDDVKDAFKKTGAKIKGFFK